MKYKLLFFDNIEKNGNLLEGSNVYFMKGGYAKINDKRFQI